MPNIIVDGWDQSGPVPVGAAGKRVLIPIGKPTEVTEAHCEALDHANIQFRRVASTKPKAPPVAKVAKVTVFTVAMLDGNVPKVMRALADLPRAGLVRAKKAEIGRDNRKGVLDGIKQLQTAV